MNKRINLFSLLLLYLVFPNFSYADNYWAGPSGGTGGYPFEKRLASNERVCGIYVRHANRIDSIQLKICDLYGNSYRSDRFGGDGGSESYFPIAEDEYLSSVLVYLGDRYGGQRVFGLSLGKNKVGAPKYTLGDYAMYGKKTQNVQIIDGVAYMATIPNVFSLPGIRGIWGRSAAELDALGVIFSQKQMDNSNNYFSLTTGGTSGYYTNIMEFKGNLCQISIRHGRRIDALRFKDCKDDGSSKYSPWLGGSGGSPTTFNLSHDEYITSIEGSIITQDKQVKISSIYFLTNKRRSPTYGSMTSSKFSLPIPKNRRLSGISANLSDEVHGLRAYIE